MPVVLIAVASLDGCITRHQEGGTAQWASREDQDHFSRATGECDVRVFGAETYRADRDGMRARLGPEVRRVVWTRTPERFVADVVPGQLEFSAEDPAALVDRLRAAGHRRLALLGGGQVYGAFLAADIVDELLLTVEPVVFGTGVRLGGDAPMQERFALVDASRLGGSTLLLRYRRPD